MIYACTKYITHGMLNRNKYTKTNSKPKPTCKCKKMSTNVRISLGTTVVHNTEQKLTVLIIFSPNLQLIITAQMLSIGGGRDYHTSKRTPINLH